MTEWLKKPSLWRACVRLDKGSPAGFQSFIILGRIQIAEDGIRLDRNERCLGAMLAHPSVNRLSGGLPADGIHVLPADQSGMAAAAPERRDEDRRRFCLLCRLEQFLHALGV